jgi:hypothetical protein
MRYEVPFEEERARDDQLLKSPIRPEGVVPSLLVRRALVDDHTVLFWVLLVLVQNVGIASLLGKTPHSSDEAGEGGRLVLGSASLLETRMYASGDRRGTRIDVRCRSDLGCTWRITVTCHLSVTAKGFCDKVGAPSACICVWLYYEMSPDLSSGLVM